MKVLRSHVLTEKRLKEILHYDPLTGFWVWLKSRFKRYIGKRAGYIDLGRGYRRIKIDGRLYISSRLAFLYMEGYFPEYDVDHINRIRHDDRWQNLRHVSRQCNIRNCNIQSNNKVGVTGVYWQKNEAKWRSHITINEKSFHLGLHADINEAILHRFAAEQCLGWHNCDASSSAYNYAIKNNLIRI